VKRAARDAVSDGRVQRGERSREAIVAAMFALVGEGALEPTAERVAARARVGLRSVFRHFADMESLYAALDARLGAEIAPLLAAGEPRGNAAQRARALVARRARLFERIRPYKRAANYQRQRSPFLDARHRTLVALLRSDLERWLPEARALAPARAAALELATSFEAWERLREDQRLSAARTQGAVLASVLALLARS
jgi:AcrR family transcriptional regulator